MYAFPPTTQAYWDKGFADFAARWMPILDVFDEVDVDFALEIHPTEIAFDLASMQRALDRMRDHPEDHANFQENNAAFQRGVYEAAGNPALRVVMETLWLLVRDAEPVEQGGEGEQQRHREQHGGAAVMGGGMADQRSGRRARHEGGDPEREASFRWKSGNYPGEDQDPAQVRAWGPNAWLRDLMQPLRPGEEVDGETHRLGAYSARLWLPMLRAEVAV